MVAAVLASWPRFCAAGKSRAPAAAPEKLCTLRAPAATAAHQKSFIASTTAGCLSQCGGADLAFGAVKSGFCEQSDMSLVSRIVKAFRGDRLSREIEEPASHIADASDNNRDRGEARAFGSVHLYREASGYIRVVLWLDSLRADFVLAWRRLRKSKVTSAAAILSLALGIGACLAAFQLIDALLLRPLPIAAPDRLYALSRREFPMNGQPTTRDTWEYPLFRGMRAAVASQATLIAISNAERVEITLSSDGEMERAHVQYVSGDMFDTFGLHAAACRLLSPNDALQPGAHPVAVLSHDY